MDNVGESVIDESRNLEEQIRTHRDYRTRAHEYRLHLLRHYPVDQECPGGGTLTQSMQGVAESLSRRTDSLRMMTRVFPLILLIHTPKKRKITYLSIFSVLVHGSLLLLLLFEFSAV